MRRIEYHRNAARYMRKMPRDRKEQVKAAVETVAGLEDPLTHPNVVQMSGDWLGCFRIRVGSYRVIFRLVPDAENGDWEAETLEVLQVGPRGGVY